MEFVLGLMNFWQQRKKLKSRFYILTSIAQHIDSILKISTQVHVF